MASILKSLRLLADGTRIRILLLLEREELSVTELQEILGIGQSTLSTHLSQLKQAAIVEDRRTGKNILYRLKTQAAADRKLFSHLTSVFREAAAQIPEAAEDMDALRLVLNRRQDKARAYFDALAGRFGRQYVPGRSWQGLSEMLLTLLPPLVIADLGAGEGTLALMLSRRANKVIAIDNSEKMVEFGASAARKHKAHNLEYRQGDLESLPVAAGSVDVALLSQSLHHAQHPERAVEEAWRIIRSGGRIVILDLVKHHLEEARELYADRWLGFTEVELQRLLRKAAFKDVHTSVVHREPDAPHFETLLATGEK